MDAWVVQEMGDVDLKDKRRNHRACRILQSFAAVGESTPDAVRDTAELKATYRLMNMDDLNPEALLAPHRQQTIARTAEHPRVLLIQDTTEVDLTRPRRQIKGAGPLTSNYSSGFYLHPLLAYSGEGVPLGVVSSHHWARQQLAVHETAAGKRRHNYRRAIEDKESFRWVQMVRQCNEVATQHPNTQYVCVADSESDLYELFAESENCSDNLYLLIRACHDRVVLDWEIADRQGSSADCRTISDVLSQSPLRYTTLVEVGPRKASASETKTRHKSRDARVADLEVRAATVTLQPPRRSGGTRLPAIQLNVVEAREASPPADTEPVHWMLLTTLPVTSEVDLKAILKDYAHRWLIENYFMTLKSGLGIEKLQYQTLDRYLNAVAMLMIVAWRVQLLTLAARLTPETHCDVYFEPAQWKSVWMIVNRGQVAPLESPPLCQFLKMVAQLGGYINKKSQGPPGVKTVWRGMKRMDTLTEAFNAFGPETICGV